MAKLFNDRFHTYTEDQIECNPRTELYEVDENTDGGVDYSFGNPDFSYMQFRSNLVVRWEYTPGSELFLVWTQNRNGSGDPMDDLGSNLSDYLFEQQGHNIFLLKWTYRFIF